MLRGLELRGLIQPLYKDVLQYVLRVRRVFHLQQAEAVQRRAVGLIHPVKQRLIHGLTSLFLCLYYVSAGQKVTKNSPAGPENFFGQSMI